MEASTAHPILFEAALTNASGIASHYKIQDAGTELDIDGLTNVYEGAVWSFPVVITTRSDIWAWLDADISNTTASFWIRFTAAG